MNMQSRPHRRRSVTRRHALPLAFIAIGFALACAMLLGGASRENYIQVSIIELASIPALMCALWRLTMNAAWPNHRLAVMVLATVVFIPLFHLIPIPASLWAQWPGHAATAQSFHDAGVEIGWRSISLAPTMTAGHALALLPPIAIFLCALAVDRRERTWLALIVIIGALTSLAIGAGQVGTGADSPLYFYDPTNIGSAVGLFSNRNHQAALLVVCLPLAALWIELGRKSDNFRVLIMTGALAIFLVAIIGLVIVQSRAGVFLLVPSLAASLAIILTASGQNNRRLVTMIAGGIALVLLVGGVFGMGPLIERFSDGLVDGRGVTSATVIEAASSYLPFGSGIGSFVPVYMSVEPVETMSRAFWNHAHNDLAELWLEAGLLAAIAFAAFLFWWLIRAIQAIRMPAGIDASLARAGAAVTALLMIHSTVDYPLRTLSLACVFALSCGLMEAGRYSTDNA